jgi:hypothetical protein
MDIDLSGQVHICLSFHTWIENTCVCTGQSFKKSTGQSVSHQVENDTEFFNERNRLSVDFLDIGYRMSSTENIFLKNRGKSFAPTIN